MAFDFHGRRSWRRAGNLRYCVWVGEIFEPQEIFTTRRLRAFDGGLGGPDQSEAQYLKLPAEWLGKGPAEAKERLWRVPGGSGMGGVIGTAAGSIL